MSSDFDVLDIVATNDEPPLQSFRHSNTAEQSTNKAPAKDEDEPSVDHIPLQLLRRVSETVTESILSDYEPEKQRLLRSNNERQRPLPPPRAHAHYAAQKHLKGQQDMPTGANDEAKGSKQQQQQQQQQQTNNKALGQSDNMTQYGNTGAQGAQSDNHTTPSHTKLDIQKFSEDYNNATTDGSNETVGDAAQNAATIILTPTSLNLTNTMQNVVGGADNNNGGPGNNGASFPTRPEPYKGPKWWRHFALQWPHVSEHFALFAIFLGVWSMAWVLLPDYAKPSTVIMRIVLLFVGAQISGLLMTFIKLPDMLGMLFFGVLYTNVGWANFEGYQSFELFLREMALINIMLLAGLGLDGGAFRRLWLMVLRLALLPTIAEVTVIAVLAYLTLGMPWLWGLSLGFVVTAVSPNVVVTVMLKLREEHLGLNSGIHTLIYAMTACNDVVSIFMFGVTISVIFSTGTFIQQFMQGPIGIGIGVVFGYVYGMLLQYLPSRNAVYANSLRLVLTILGGAIAVMGSRVVGYTSAGALGCVSMAFIASIGWKREEHKMTPQQLQAHQTGSVTKRLDLLWKFLKPVSFSLIGKEINFAVLEGRVIGYGALLVLLGSLFRLAFAYLSTYGGNLSRKERAYITICGFPKATVQAALGPIALGLARAATEPNDTHLALANNVLIISVLAIIFTAPLGAILMLRLAPVLLKSGDAVDLDAAETPNTPNTPAAPKPNARNAASNGYKSA